MTESPCFVFGRIQPAITRCRESRLPGFRQIDPVMSAFEKIVSARIWIVACLEQPI